MKKNILFTLIMSNVLIAQYPPDITQQFETTQLIRNNKEILSDLFCKSRVRTQHLINKLPLLNAHFINDDKLLILKDTSLYHFLTVNPLKSIDPTVSTLSEIDNLVLENENKLKKNSRDFRFDTFPSFTHKLYNEFKKNDALVAKSPDNNLIATVLPENNNMVCLYNFKNILVLRAKHDANIESLTFSNNSKWLVVTGGSNAKFFHLESLSNLQQHVFNLPTDQFEKLIYLIKNPETDISHDKKMLNDFDQFDSQLQRILEKKYSITTPSSTQRARFWYYGIMMFAFCLEALQNKPHDWALPLYNS